MFFGWAGVGCFLYFQSILTTFAASFDPKNPPAFSADLQMIDKNVYHIQFDDDSYPCKRIYDSEVPTLPPVGGYQRVSDVEVIVPHPLYGSYVIINYLALYNENKEKNSETAKKYLDAAVQVGLATIRKMKEIKKYNALAFVYHKGFMGSSSFWKDTYSGLTQSYYACNFYNLYQITNKPEFLEASEKCFNSLFIPIEDGGILHQSGEDKLVTEYTYDVPDMVLNGCIEIAKSIKQYGDLNKAKKQQAEDFYNKQLGMIKRYLPLYDVPEYSLTRYMLAGPLQFRVKVPKDLKIKSIQVDVPNWKKRKIGFMTPIMGIGNDMYSYVDERSVDKFEDHFKAKDGFIDVNILVSRLSYPRRNTIILEYESDQVSSCSVEAFIGTMHPLYVVLHAPKAIAVKTFSTKLGRVQQVEIDIPWLHDAACGHLTPWNREKEGKWYNGYHFIHVSLMKQLYKETGDQEYLFYANRWEQYPKGWPVYNLFGLNLSFDPFTS